VQAGRPWVGLAGLFYLGLQAVGSVLWCGKARKGSDPFSEVK
jgi:hypothetical protein